MTKERLKSPRARMFVALELPIAARELLTLWQGELLALNRDELRATLTDSLITARLFDEDDGRDYWPHVTLCRVKSSVCAHRAPPQLPAAPPSLAGQAFTAEFVTLFRSELLPQGAKHTPLARLALGGAVSDASAP